MAYWWETAWDAAYSLASNLVNTSVSTAVTTTEATYSPVTTYTQQAINNAVTNTGAASSTVAASAAQSTNQAVITANYPGVATITWVTSAVNTAYNQLLDSINTIQTDLNDKISVIQSAFPAWDELTNQTIKGLPFAMPLAAEEVKYHEPSFELSFLLKKWNEIQVLIREGKTREEVEAQIIHLIDGSLIEEARRKAAEQGKEVATGGFLEIGFGVLLGFMGSTTTNAMQAIGGKALAQEAEKIGQHTLLPESVLKQAYNRAIIPLNVHEEQLWRKGYNTDNRNIIKSLYTYVPGTSDMVRFAIREAYDKALVDAAEKEFPTPPLFIADAKLNGMLPDRCKQYWYSHWVLPSPSALYSMWNRGILPPLKGEPLLIPTTLEQLANVKVTSKQFLKEWLKLNDYHPLSIEQMQKLAETLPTRVDIRRMYGLGVLERDQVKFFYMQRGYSEDNAELMTRLTEAMYIKDPESPIAKERELTKSEIIKAYKIDNITREDALLRLTELDYSEDEADFLLELNKVAELSDTRELSRATIQKLFEEGIINRAEAELKLTKIDYSADAVKHLLQLSDIRIEGTTKTLPFGYLGELFRKQILSETEYKTYLTSMGYCERDIKLIVKNELTKVKAS